MDPIYYPLVTHEDDRGFLREIVKSSEVKFTPRQITWTTTYPGVIKAFHYHEHQTDLWCCVRGNIRVVTFPPATKDFAQFFLGENNPGALLIPAQVRHGYQVLGTEPVTLIYATDQEYDPDNPDERRVHYDYFDWTVKNR